MSRTLIYAVVYAIGAYGALQLGKLNLGHSICGPWGCGPPTSALLAMHSFWLVTSLVGVAALSHTRIDLKRTGFYVAMGSLVAIVTLGIADFLTWRPQPFELEGMYLWQRFLFRLATLTDLPVVQLGLAGALAAMIDAWRSTTQAPAHEVVSQASGDRDRERQGQE